MPSAIDPIIKENLEIIFKISERCNLKCKYCYFFFGGDDSFAKHPPTVNMDVVKSLGKFLRDAALEHGIKEINVGLHGGEPLLLKKGKFDELCLSLREASEGAFTLRLKMQTNGALIDDEWIALFRKHKIDIGVSIDGPKEINDENRINQDGSGSYEQVTKGWFKLLDAAREGGISGLGILSVINPAADGASMYRHMVDSLQCRSMNFILPTNNLDDGVSEETIRAIGRFRADVLDEWIRDRDYKIRVRFIYSAVAPMAFAKSARAVKGVVEDTRNLISVSSNGDVGPEDVVRTLAPRFSNMGMNISSHTLSDVVSSEQWQEMKLAMTPPEACSTCEWWNICRGGRLCSRYSTENGFNNKSIYCGEFKQFYATVRNFLVDGGISSGKITSNLNA